MFCFLSTYRQYVLFFRTCTMLIPCILALFPAFFSVFFFFFYIHHSSSMALFWFGIFFCITLLLYVFFFLGGGGCMCHVATCFSGHVKKKILYIFFFAAWYHCNTIYFFYHKNKFGGYAQCYSLSYINNTIIIMI